MLTVENVCKSFGKMLAVDHVSFRLEPKEIYGIAGPNGAGKTTLFNVISGTPFKADGGQILFGKQPIHKAAAHTVCHMGIARTFQKETLFETLTVWENARLSAAYGKPGSDKAESERRAGEALDLTGLKSHLGREARHLSLFDKKRLMIASALATHPKIVLLDEPAAGLNRIEIRETINLIRRINGQGIAVILIEHVLPVLLTLSHRVMIMNQGRTLVEGSPEEVVKNEQVIQAYLGTKKTG